MRRAATLGLLAAVTACSGPSPSATPSQRVVYRVEDSSQAAVRVTTQTVDVESPSRARILTRDANGQSLGGLAWTQDRTLLIAANGTVSAIAEVAPQFAGVALSLATALASAERHRLVARNGTGRVLSRACVWWLSREPLDAGPAAPAVDGDRAETCVSPEGLLLEERWSLGGKQVRHRTAVQVQDGPSLAGSRLLDGRTAAPAPATPAPEQVKDVPVQTLVQALAVTSPDAPFGLAPARSTAVIQSAETGGVDVEGGVLSWTDGHRLVVLRMERGLTRRLSVDPGGTASRLTDGRDVRLSPVPQGLRLQMAGGQALVATITANVPESDLLAWAATLRLG